MRRIVIWIASTVTVVVLLFGYHTSTSPTATAAGSTSAAAPAAPSSSSSSGPPTPSSGSGSSGTKSSGTASSGTTSSGTATSGTKTWTGDAAPTRYGPVQVEITVAGGRVTKVDVLQSPSSSPRDVQIADRALPVLVQETLSAQSAKIDVVSGATYTSEGYTTSLQSALDQAGI